MKKNGRALLSVDPGLNSLGYAWWPREGIRRASMVPEVTGLLKAPRKLELTARARWLANELDGLIRVRAPESDIVCEYPSYHGASHMLGWQTGDLQKLTFLVGVIAGHFRDHEFTPVTPGEWKGQLPKHVVISRLQKRFGPGATQWWEKDVWDAVGIGLWKLGKF